MTSATMKPKIVRVMVEEKKSDLYYATSPDLKGLLVAERTLEDLDRAIPRAVTDLYAACGVKVIVSQADDSEDSSEHGQWVAFPLDLARKGLAAADA